MSSGIKKIEQRFGCKINEPLIIQIYEYLEKNNNEEADYLNKDLQTNLLIPFIDEHGLWFDDIQFSIYLAEGAEQKVFYNQEKRKVLKYNDAIFYVNWLQYFEGILIHNILFTETKYTFIGFIKINYTLYAAVEQEYIEPTELTDIALVRKYMNSKGFQVKKKNDYIHEELGLIIEDLHEENVIIRNNILFFIDTVIYLK